MSNSNIPKTYEPGYGARLAAARKKLKITQGSLGSLLGVRNTAVSKWELEGAQPDERTLLTLMHTKGINPRWIAVGEEPMLLETWNRDAMRDAVDQVAGAPTSGVWIVPALQGMEPLFQEGDLVTWTAEPISHGAVVIMAPKSLAAPTHDGVASPRCKMGRAIQTSMGWLLYRDQDAKMPGSFSPLPLDGAKVLGRVTAVMRKVAAVAAAGVFAD